MTGRSRPSLRLVGLGLSLVGVGVVALLRISIGWPASLAAGVLLGAIPGLALIAISFLTRSEAMHRRLSSAGVALAAAALAAVVAQVVVIVGVDGRPDENERRLLLLALASSIAAALVYPSLRRRFEAWVRKGAARSPLSTRELVDRIDRAVARELPIDELLIQAAEGLRATHRANVVEIWTGTPERLILSIGLPPRRAHAIEMPEAGANLVARTPVSGRSWAQVWLPDLVAELPVSADDELAVAPLSSAGALCGLIVIGRTGTLTEEERQALELLGRRLSPAVDNAQLGAQLERSMLRLRRQARELQASRSRLVSAGDEVRRRIEADLHDGVQQQLVALSLSLGLCGRMLDEGRTGEAVELVTQLNEETTQLASTLRDLAHGIYPPLLRDAGLQKALRALASRHEDVHFQGSCGRLARSVEATVYFCCAEAIQNAHKHADGARIEITLAQDEDGVRFSVSDDGPGFDSETRSGGLGLTNMRDRVGGMGGTLEIDTGTDGTSVRGMVPCAGAS